MLGKRLFYLLNSLTKSEHKQLAIQCARNNDKRSSVLRFLLKKNCKNVELYQGHIQTFLNRMLGKSDKKKNNTLRRWIDYSCTFIESILIKNEIDSNQQMKHYILASHFDKGNHNELTSYYNDTAIELHKNIKRYNTLSELYTIRMRWLAKTQFKKDIDQLKKSLFEKKHFDELFYIENLTSYFNILSGLFIDNPYDTEIKNQIPSKKQIQQLIENANNEYDIQIYKLAFARFQLFNNTYIHTYFANALNEISQTHLSLKEKDVLTRSVFFLKNTYSLYYGVSTFALLDDNTRNIQITTAYKIQDTISVFFYLFALILNQKHEEFDKQLKKLKPFFNSEDIEYLYFLNVLNLVILNKKNINYDKIAELNHSKSIYIAFWSRLLEIHIHIKNKNIQYAINLINRTNQYFKTYKKHKIIYDTSRKIIIFYKEYIKNNQSNIPTNLHPFYQYLCDFK